MQTVLYPQMTIVSEGSRKPGESPEASILKTLAYFSIFQYPLLKCEIKQFGSLAVSDEAFERAMQQLLATKNIFRLDDFYSLKSDFLQSEKRISGNRRAGQLLPKAMKIGRFLFQFPYVRAIGISGSLSKQFADEKADIDFFVVTKANRAWIARTIMHLYKKFTFLTGRQHLYCMNYYVDEEALRMEDRNIFIAIEVKTLLPVCGKETLDNFFMANNWTDRFLPACGRRQQMKSEPGKSWIKRFGEWIFNNRLGDWLDDSLVRITTRRWQQKEKKGKRNQKGKTMGLVTGKHFARSNPDSFQENILSLYKQKLVELQLQFPQWFDEQFFHE